MTAPSNFVASLKKGEHARHQYQPKDEHGRQPNPNIQGQSPTSINTIENSTMLQSQSQCRLFTLWRKLAWIERLNEGG